jgi:structural maintenance of chromosome 1
MFKLQSVVNASDDKVFSAFCRKIKVKNIREYEERQLKALQEGAEARTRFNTQINRLTHQLSPPWTSLLCEATSYV